MKLIVESMNDIKTKIDIYKNEIERYQKENDSIKVNEIQIELNKLENTYNNYVDKLSNMNGIEYILYSNILKGYNISKAVEKTTEEYNYDKVEREWISERTVWNKYKNIKKIIQFQ